MLFTLLGLLLAGFGLIADAAIYQRSLGHNVNLWWGLVLLAFGLVMLFLGRKGTAAARPRKPSRGAGHRGAGARARAGARLKHGNYNLAQSRRDAEGEPQLFSASPRLCVRCLGEIWE